MSDLTAPRTKHFRSTAAVLGVALALAAMAGPAVAQASAPAAASAQALTSGEVRKIDKATLSVTIKHGEIRNLEMPPMTMVFKARDAAMVAKLKVGDKVRFHAEKSKDDLVLTVLEPAR